MLPEWLELIRAIGTLSIWLLTPLMIWFCRWSVRQHQKWEAGKLERYERWKVGMEEVAKMREEASRSREEAVRLRGQAEVMLAQAEVAHAQARRHFTNGNPSADPD
jgi:hypothetical protein